jgi:Protein of unknown function (DUF1638)
VSAKIWSSPRSPHTVVIGCGALGRELVALTRDLPGVRVTFLPATLHMRPERIAPALGERIAAVRAEHGEGVRVFVAYADCGTGGSLDAVLAGTGIGRLAGAHCYEVYGGTAALAALQDDEPGTFYLTDFLARQFETLVWAGLGLDRHPELVPQMFGNYRRLVYLAQTDDPHLDAAARAAATRLDVRYERRDVGLGELAPTIAALGVPA